MESAYLTTKKVNGGAYGMPNLATINPVLQMSTKTAGMALIQASAAPDDSEEFINP
jgi:hypothetical protein